MAEEVKEKKTKAVKSTAEKTAAPKTTKTAAAKTAAPKAEKVAEKPAKVAAPKTEKATAPKAEKPVAKKPAVKKAKSKMQEFGGTGRRKCSVARVRVAVGTGVITVNGKKLEEYFDLDTLITIVKQPLVLTETDKSVDVVANIVGGGKSGQAGALRHGITRALIEFRPELRAELKKAGFVTRDPRKKERKKYGLKKARRAPQFTKR